jgi:hypothetical protein
LNDGSFIPYPEHHILQIPPEIASIIIVFVLGFVFILCLGCGLGAHYLMKRSEIKNKANQLGVPIPQAPNRSLCKYGLFFLIAFLLPGALFTTPLGSFYGMYILWYWVMLFVVAVPIVLLYEHFTQMRQWAKLLTKYEPPLPDEL